MDAVDRGNLHLSLRALALGAVLFALACLAVLVVVVSVQNVDTLSTVALVLAVLAFVVQIIVFLFQSAETSRQAEQGRVLHAQLLSLVSQLDERTQGTQKSMEFINTRLLEAVIGKARNEGIDLASPAFTSRVASAITSHDAETSHQPAATRQRPARRAPSAPEYPDPLPADEAQAIQEELSRPLDAAEAREVTDLIAGLEDYELWQLSRFANDLDRSTQPDSRLGTGLNYSGIEGLKARGIVQKIPGWRLYTLSPKGRLVGRLFTASIAQPDVAPTLVAVLDRVELEATRIRGRISNRDDE